MSEAPVAATNGASGEPMKRRSPPSTPPSDSESGVKTSRKREREISQEPVTAPIATVDGARDTKETRAPKKKNRLNLESTAEEDDAGSRSRSTSPTPPNGSPPQEMKATVVQISRGVEDLTWRKSQDGKVVELAVDSPAKIVQDDKDTPTVARVGETEAPASALPEKRDEDMAAHTEEPAPAPQTAVVDVPSTLSKAEKRLSARRDSDSDSGERDKGIKRKFPDRGTSQGPADAEPSSHEATKRPRDDPDKDDNPRETKRPSPPPESAKKPAETPKKLKSSGFSAYASKSGFSVAKGPSIFSSAGPSTPSTFSLASPTPPLPATPIFGQSSVVTPPVLSPSVTRDGSSTPSGSPAPAPSLLSGFGAFANSGSPFKALNRSKSPPRKTTSTSSAALNAFSQYKGNSLQTFKKGHVAAKKSASTSRPNSPIPASGNENGIEEEPAVSDQQTTFGDKLRAVHDDEDESSDRDNGKLNLTEQEVIVTGEEQERTIYSIRGKLYSLDGATWKERGVGLLKLNLHDDTGRVRILMRKDAVHATLLNVPLFHGMHCELAQDPRYLRFSSIEGGVTIHFNLRLRDAQTARDLLQHIQTRIPAA
ncbi:hypothetical protein CYLTODRAFT_490106 [Cylindrobasidium torrendii FP15055 ss-10]|uniref:RanBD1 domain-containing protein n=1 Tax=Cylindrobasidium torrendii FP15055 ss-10 TaxID=1314674 RepID=A0A0D7BCY5_9AGAR|nr:hypothetical protein CYLTODRAFT_490106 [Cylindrobasidium torrendii FP15055 ss-10]